MPRLPLLLAAALFLVTAPPALAQSAASVSFGLTFGVQAPTNPDAQQDNGPGVVLRMRAHQGLGPSLGFNWFSPNVRRTIGGERVWLGKVNIRPLMAGATYTWERARTEAQFSVEAGYAFTNIRDTGAARRAYARQLNVRNVGIHAANTGAWATSLTMWFDLGSNFGLMASLGYVGVRPVLTTSSSAGVARERIDLGAVTTSLGLVYAIF